jgi:hypothetical protein
MVYIYWVITVYPINMYNYYKLIKNILEKELSSSNNQNQEENRPSHRAAMKKCSSPSNWISPIRHVSQGC